MLLSLSTDSLIRPLLLHTFISSASGYVVGALHWCDISTYIQQEKKQQINQQVTSINETSNMANVTDPLARAIHGTNPQNLIEYITRQKIYDSQYWKEECFGLSAVDIAEKAALQIKAVGGSYGGNSKPTRFLCLVLKMLQIQPDEDIVEELISNEDFKYVRALGRFICD